MPRVNSQGFVDVRFFGEHARAWVAPKDIYLYSKEPPAPSSRKRKSDMDECVREITRHCRKLELMFGQFKFAPPKVQYNPNDPIQITLMLPNYNPMNPDTRLVHSETPESKKKIPPRKRSLNKDKSQHDESINEDNGQLNASKESLNGNNQKKEDEVRERKVQKLDFDDAKDTANLKSNLDDNNDKLSKKVDQQVAKVAQNKTAKSGAKRTKIQVVKVNENNNALSSNTTTSGKSTPQKLKNEEKSVAGQSPKSSHKSPDATRVRKKSAAKNAAAPKRETPQNAPKSPQKNAKSNSTKSYKPKKQIVDKLNAGKTPKSISTSKNNRLILPKATGTIAIKRSLLGNNSKDSTSTKKNSEIDITMSSPAASIMQVLPRIEPRPIIQSTNIQTAVPFVPSKDPNSMLFFVMNNGASVESSKQQAATILADCPENKDMSVAIQREAKDTRDNSSQKKESKAKKSFPGKSRGDTQVSLRTTTATEFPAQVSIAKCNTTSGVSSSTSTSTYQLLPPEAGPISARLHHSAQELARRMGQLMEEAYKEAAEAGDGKGENGTADNYQATIFFLRMQIEHMKWQHQQQIAELKHNAGMSLFLVSSSAGVFPSNPLECFHDGYF